MSSMPQKLIHQVEQQARDLPHQLDRGIKAMVPSDQEPLIDEGKQIIKRYLLFPVGFNMEYEICKSRAMLQNLKDFPAFIDRGLVQSQIKDADAVAFVTVGRAGLFLTGQIGSGLVVARTNDGSWTAPSAIAYYGSGFGLQGGFDLTDYILILKSQTVDAFKSGWQVVVSGDVGVVPIYGRHGSADLHSGKKSGVAFAWAAAKGWYAGASANAGLMRTKHEINAKFYGREVDPSDLLSGKVSRPRAARQLYDALERV